MKDAVSAGGEAWLRPVLGVDCMGYFSVAVFCVHKLALRLARSQFYRLGRGKAAQAHDQGLCTAPLVSAEQAF